MTSVVAQVHAVSENGTPTYIKCTDASDRKFSCFMRAFELGRAGSELLYGPMPSSLFHMHLHTYDPDAADAEQSCRSFKAYRAVNHPVWNHHEHLPGDMMFKGGEDDYEPYRCVEPRGGSPQPRKNACSPVAPARAAAGSP